MLKKSELAGIIDHTNLNPQATQQDIQLLCSQAKEYGFYSVCVNPFRAEAAKKLLEGSPVKLCVVIGFPLGAVTTEQKCNEAEEMVRLGADELDMVMNIGAAKDGNFDLVRADIAAVKKVARNAVLKVIIETCYLTDEEKRSACKAAAEAGADFVKTSTGFGPQGAVEYDIMLMKESGLKVKASGGIRTFEDAAAMMAAGADRLGASAGVSILNDPRLQ